MSRLSLLVSLSALLGPRKAALRAVLLFSAIALVRCDGDVDHNPAKTSDGATDVAFDVSASDGSGGVADAGHEDTGAAEDSQAGSDAGTADVADATDSADVGPDTNDASGCAAIVAAPPDEGAGHDRNCRFVSYVSNPPSSGTHYDSWAAFGEYTEPLPRGFWVHNLEHGAIVISYRCPQGCDADLARARAFLGALLPDPLCLSQGQPVPRVILTPDPLLDVSWAASAWGFTLRAPCFDQTSFEQFYADHYGKGPENICSPGPDFRIDGGGLSVPAWCGAADAGDASWP